MTHGDIGTNVESVVWVRGPHDGHLRLLEQRELPHAERWLDVRTADETVTAIRDMSVRGAPAIGLAAAWGAVLAARSCADDAAFDAALDSLAAARPTAVNLMWAIRRVRAAAAGLDRDARVERLFAVAMAIRQGDIDANRAIGDAGAALLPESARVLTICNTGSLATPGIGTALGVIRRAWATGRLGRAIACETRPYLQGARLTMWELLRDQIPAVLISDNMAGHLMARGEVDAVIAGADRIAANGDAANKIGTYSLAVLARYHNLPFYIAAPWSTVDLATPNGAAIPIEQRSAAEVVNVLGVRIAPEGVEALHPAFDVTPGELITAIITERGVFRPRYADSLHDHGQGASQG
jgi:methylthioribose-1-phosphate isomerase